MNDQMKQELKQAVVNLMHKNLQTLGINCIAECISILKIYEKAGEPILAFNISDIQSVVEQIEAVEEVKEEEVVQKASRKRK